MEHSSRILATAGWQVRFVGTRSLGAAALRLEPHPGVDVRLWNFQNPGWRQKAHYLAFVAWALWNVIAWRPRWIYASDLFATPVGVLAGLLPFVRVCYHEHDSPSVDTGDTRFMRAILWARATLARRARFCVLPNRARLEHFREEVRTTRPVLCVWNCPSRDEVGPPAALRGSGDFAILYHGSIVPQRLPLTVLDALARLPNTATLRVIGYETAGSQGYMQCFIERARSLGIENRVHYVGTVPTRAELLEFARRSCVGLALMPTQTDNINQRHMEGASNKPFEYLASGLALVISDIAAWKELFEEAGYAVTCDPEDAETIYQALSALYADSTRTRTMGEAGRARVASEWNYERQFEPVMRYLESEAAH